MKKDIIGLGLESSCDETAAAVVRNGREILSSSVFSQIDLHRIFYGVVPEIASRSHLETVNSLIDDALKTAGTGFSGLDYVAVTNRPGLIGSLLVTVQSAKAISFAMDIPLVGINHLEAHLYAPFLEGHEPLYPHLGLIISGGNTALYRVDGVGLMEELGRTCDDAAGEAFDKVAKLLDIGYPGGPAVERLARKALKKNIVLPKILTEPGDRRFSYSGIKTAVVNLFRGNPGIDRAELVYSFQERALEVLVRRLLSASRELGIRDMVVAGGVACNGRLREMLARDKGDDETILFPSPSLCTDNAAMVAGLGYHYFMKGVNDGLALDVFSRA